MGGFVRRLGIAIASFWLLWLAAAHNGLRVGLDLVLTVFAPNDQADLCSGCGTQRHRWTGLGLHWLVDLSVLSAAWEELPVVRCNRHPPQPLWRLRSDVAREQETDWSLTAR